MLKNKLNALLFSSGRKMSIEELSKLTRAGEDEAQSALEELKKELGETKEAVEVRIKSLGKTEERINSRLKDIQDKLKEVIR